jgi:hypothetical protein
VLHSYDVRVSKLIVQLLMISLITVLMAFEAHSPAIDDLSHHSVDGFHLVQLLMISLITVLMAFIFSPPHNPPHSCPT